MWSVELRVAGVCGVWCVGVGCGCRVWGLGWRGCVGCGGEVWCVGVRCGV